MADGMDTNTDQPIVDPKAELAQHMALALGTAVPESTITAPPPVADPPVTVPVTTDTFGVFKERFGYDTPESAIKDIEELRAFKANPVRPDLKFENETSERIFKSIKGGKTDELRSYLNQQAQIDLISGKDVTAETAADIVKMGMQLKYKDLSPAEINHRFNKQFAIPPKPAMAAGEDQEDYDDRVAAWETTKGEKEMDLIIEAKLAKPDLINAKQNLVFPDIAAAVDPEYAQYRKMLEDNDRSAAQAEVEYKKLTPKSAETRINFNDENNKIAFEFQYEPTAEDFQKSVAATVDEGAFWNLFNNPDGTPNRAKFLRVINYAMNEDKILLEAMKQAKNATIKASLPDNRQGGFQRQLVTEPGEPSELDKNMQRSGVRKAV